MRQGSSEQSAVIRHAIETGGRDNISKVMAAIESTDAIAYTARKAREEADLAIQQLQHIPASHDAEALKILADFSVSRTY